MKFYIPIKYKESIMARNTRRLFIIIVVAVLGRRVITDQYNNYGHLAMQNRSLVEFAYLPTEAALLIRGPKGLNGRIKFSQQQSTTLQTSSPVLMVAVSINNLPQGDYVLRVHNYGDTSDKCKIAAGKQWAELYRFTIKDKKDAKEYMTSFKRYDLSLSDEFNILGRAVSLTKAGDGYDTENALSCEAIGLTSQVLEQISGPEPTKSVINNFIYG